MRLLASLGKHSRSHHIADIYICRRVSFGSAMPRSFDYQASLTNKSATQALSSHYHEAGVFQFETKKVTRLFSVSLRFLGIIIATTNKACLDAQSSKAQAPSDLIAEPCRPFYSYGMDICDLNHGCCMEAGIARIFHLCYGKHNWRRVPYLIVSTDLP